MSDDRDYLEPHRLYVRLDLSMEVKISACDVDNPDDSIPTLDQVTDRIQEAVYRQIEDEVCIGGGDVEIDGLQELAEDCLNIIKAEASEVA